MSLALYRKYRPKILSDFVGHDYIIEILRNAARKNKLTHAYLFYGSRGTGKTSAARIVAKIANCFAKEIVAEQGEPCGHCAACRQIDSGHSLDIIEIDAASNRGIDEIRNLKESVKLSPSSLSKKIFIIDETHMLTKDAFNALLKTLEEPPPHAIFILATTEYEKIPATISSRTQKFHFRKLTVKEIFEKLKTVSQKEKIKISAPALELIAASADGSLRDAESLLDQISAVADEIDLSTVEKTIGQIGLKKVITLAGHILNKNIKTSLAYLNELNQGGYNLTELNKELIVYLRRALALKIDPQLEELFTQELTKEDLNHLKNHSQLLQPETHIKLLKSLIRAHSEMRYSPFAIVPFEVAIIENLEN